MGVHNSRNTVERVKALHNASAIDWVLHVGDISYSLPHAAMRTRPHVLIAWDRSVRYADDYAGNIYEYVWDQWFKRMDPLPASVPYMVGPGNHEFSCMHPLCAVYSSNFTAYNHRFRYNAALVGALLHAYTCVLIITINRRLDRMPGLESGSNTSMFYSFDYALAHFISLSSETDYPYAYEGLG
jgi:hypothetical protein